MHFGFNLRPVRCSRAPSCGRRWPMGSISLIGEDLSTKPPTGRALFRQFRVGRHCGAAGQGTEDPRTDPRQGPGEIFTRNRYRERQRFPANIRDGLRKALKLLKEADWSFKSQKLVNKTAEPFGSSPARASRVQRIVLRSLTISSPWASPPSSHGQSGPVRKAHGHIRLRHRGHVVRAIRCPARRQQRDYWGSPAADEAGSRNLLGIRTRRRRSGREGHPGAGPRSSRRPHARPRPVLQWGYYVIPHYHTECHASPIGTSSADQRSRRNTASASTMVGRSESEQTIEAKRARSKRAKRKGRPSSTCRTTGLSWPAPARRGPIMDAASPVPMLESYPSAGTHDEAVRHRTADSTRRDRGS